MGDGQTALQPGRHSIRHHLTQASYSGSSKLAKFVGIDAYKQAGGTVLDDLFSERDSMHLEDPDLLETLALGKLQMPADQTAEVWKWAEPHLETDYDSFRPYGRVYPEPLDPDPKLEAEMVDLQKRQDAFESNHDEETWTEALEAEEEQVRERIYEIERLQEANVAYTEEHRKIAGCIVTIGMTASRASKPDWFIPRTFRNRWRRNKCGHRNHRRVAQGGCRCLLVP